MSGGGLAADLTGPVLRIRGLNVAFQTDGVWRPAVHDLSLDIAANETVALVGESGSGKSVTALSIMRLLPEANSRISGSIALQGRDLLRLNEEAMRDVRGNAMSMIFQEPMTSLNPVLSVGAQIAETLRSHRAMSRREAWRTTIALLDQVRIPNARGRAGNYPHQFSGGMRQRVMIAMALACRPSLLIADEPTTALDVTIQAQILDLIRALQNEIGMSVLFITHDMGVVAHIADRVAVMYGGRKVEEGATETIFRAPSHSYTRTLIEAVPKLGTTTNGSRRNAAEAQPGAVINGKGAAVGETPPLRRLLDVRDLTVRFDARSGLFNRLTGRVHAVENVTFAIAPGETLAFVGESGCGKTTIGRSILGLNTPTSGAVIFEGDDVLRLDRKAMREKRRYMQVIFQDPFASLDPRQPIGAALAEPIRVHGLGDKRAAREQAGELLRKVGLEPEMATRLPHEFSGGQRQRICIARALALGPRLIVADEAVSALDVSIKARIIDLMMALQEEMGLAFLFISHDIATVERIAHRIAVLYLGEIVEIGPARAVLGNPQHAYTRRLLDAVLLADPTRRGAKPRLIADEIPSAFRAPDYRAPRRDYAEIAPGHLMQIA